MVRKVVTLESHYHTAVPAVRAAWCIVLRAGHLRAGAGDAVRRASSPGHDWLFCLRGRGRIETCGRVFAIGPGELAWLNGALPHAHEADPRDPWELLWLRVEGPTLQAAAKVLGATTNAVFHLEQPAEVAAIFRRMLAHLRRPPAAVDALLHVEISRLLACMAQTRADAGRAELSDAPRLAAALEQIEIYPQRPWRVTTMAAAAHMSPASFYRAFHRVMQTTPMAHLRMLRLHQAKRLLVETDLPIKQIAASVGYTDPLHFSREFHRLNKLSPRKFRASERPDSQTSYPLAPGTPTRVASAKSKFLSEQHRLSELTSMPKS